MMEDGFRLTNLEISINNPSKEFDPLEMTVRKLASTALASNSASLTGVVTLGASIKPELLYWIVVTEPLVEKAKGTIKAFEKKNL